MIFLFPRWDMLIPGRVSNIVYFPDFFGAPPPQQIPMIFTDFCFFIPGSSKYAKFEPFHQKKTKPKGRNVYIYLEDPGIPKNHILVTSQSAPLKSELIGVFCFDRIAFREWASGTPPRNENESDFQFLDS